MIFLPVDKDCYGDHKDDVGNKYGGDDGRHGLLSVVVRDHHPGVVGGVIAGKGLASLAVVVVFLSKNITDDVRRVAATLDVDQQRGVSHHLLLLRGLPSARICLNFPLTRKSTNNPV